MDSYRFNRLRILIAAVAIAVSPLAHAAEPAPGATAETVMTQLKQEASAGHKSILLSFGASWCGNCRLFERFLADPAIHPIMDRLFVFGEMNTGEQPNDKRHMNLPGGQALQASFGGRKAGYPYLVMLDAQGRFLIDSIRPADLGHAGNIGYPAASYEVEWFMEMLKKAAPAMTPQESQVIRSWLMARGSH